MAGEPSFWGRHRRILLYVPNLIGYMRVAFVLYAFAVAMTSPIQTIVFYYLSFCCDELDGRFARMLNQTSTLGAVLDMVTDRLATTGLLLLLCMLYPSFHLVFITLIFLDIFSHWFQMYATLLVGAASHKDTKSSSWLVRTYYSNRMFMGYCCICCEVLYLVVYAMWFPMLQNWRCSQLVMVLPSQAALLLPGIHNVFSKEGLPWLSLWLFPAIPGFLIKQFCNWRQLRTAADKLVESDLAKMK